MTSNVTTLTADVASDVTTLRADLVVSLSMEVCTVRVVWKCALYMSYGSVHCTCRMEVCTVRVVWIDFDSENTKRGVHMNIALWLICTGYINVIKSTQEHSHWTHKISRQTYS